jgi:hypothetical protein
MADLALDPVSVAVYTALNVASLQALATGGIFDDIPQEVSFPCVLYVVHEEENRGLGTGGLPKVDLNVHAYGLDLVGLQAIAKKAIELLKDQLLTVSGYNHCGAVFYDRTLTIPDSVINGVKVHELVAQFRIFVEEQ